MFKSSIRKNFAFKKGQSTLEFTFGIIGVLLLLLGMVQVFLWVGKDLVERHRAHENVLTMDTLRPSGAYWLDGSTPLEQTRPDFFSAVRLKAAVPTDIFGNQVVTLSSPGDE